MTCWVYTLARNEATLMPFWIRHYATFCERIIVYEDHSTDGTPELVQSLGAELREYPGNDTLDDLGFVHFANHTYREARGQTDWLIWVDADEFLYHPRMCERLDELKADGITVPMVAGYSMFGDAPPSGLGQIWQQIRKGVRSDAYDKIAIVNPDLEFAWNTGKHTAMFYGTFTMNDDGDPLKLLHYRWLGAEYHAARNKQNWDRLSGNNKANRLGLEIFPDYDGPYSPRWYAEQAALATDVL